VARARRFLEIDVLEAALERVRHAFDLFDTLAVCFSGGKDSLVVLHLVKQVAEERGELPVRALFRDEELLPKVLVDFVDEYRRKDWLELDWFALREVGSQYILGEMRDYTQWPVNGEREHFRPMPEWAIQQDDDDPRAFYSNDTDAFTVTRYPGKVAYMNGIRAVESITRYRSCVNKLNENWINATSHKRIKFCKPIYDWQENDVLKFFHERNIRYCPIYDWQHLAGEPLRVSTPLHQRSAKRIDRVAVRDPEFYNRLLQVFPETAVQCRYFNSMDDAAIIERYGKSWETIREYIDEIEDPRRRAEASVAFERSIPRFERDPVGYPFARVLRWIKNGAHKQELMVSSSLTRKRAEAAGRDTHSKRGRR